MASSAEHPCLSCRVLEMFRQGCCTHYSPEGVGMKYVRVGLHRVQVCANLVVGDGAPYCGDYEGRDERCREFECNRTIAWHVRR